MNTHRSLSRLHRLAADASGTAAVEFAILCPVYLFLIMGMTAYGVYFGATHSVQQISADAARAAIPGISAAERVALAQGFVERNGHRYAFIDPARLSVEVGDSAAGDGQFDVTVRYDASDLPIWGLFDGLAMPGQTIERGATIRIGGT